MKNDDFKTLRTFKVTICSMIKFWLFNFVKIFKISVVAELSFEHVEQRNPIQSSGWTRISVQLSGLDKDFCSNPRNLYVTGSVSSGSGCSTRGLGWRICSTRESGLNFCPKPNSTVRLFKILLFKSAINDSYVSIFKLLKTAHLKLQLVDEYRFLRCFHRSREFHFALSEKNFICTLLMHILSILSTVFSSIMWWSVIRFCFNSISIESIIFKFNVSILLMFVTTLHSSVFLSARIIWRDHFL